MPKAWNSIQISNVSSKVLRIWATFSVLSGTISKEPRLERALLGDACMTTLYSLHHSVGVIIIDVGWFMEFRYAFPRDFFWHFQIQGERKKKTDHCTVLTNRWRYIINLKRVPEKEVLQCSSLLSNKRKTVQ